VRAFDNPSSRAVTWHAAADNRFLSPRAYVRRPSVRFDQLAYVGVIVTFVQAQVNLLVFWLWSPQLFDRFFEQFLVVAVGPVDNER
jgi:hypothetical protein